MTTQEVKTMLASTNIPTAYYQFDNDSGQEPPFICFFYSGSQDLMADNSNYQKIEHLIVELYTAQKDFETEAALEAVLAESGMSWSRNETYIDSERLYEVVYEMDVVITPSPEPEPEPTPEPTPEPEPEPEPEPDPEP